ncbi:unnamed protein product [Pieris macdunnoughi]|uniref:CRAL-TRIO domain-containing protein n=1 Tax=Pieris macdunnoughi TaxID=345717 RepID=A0A821U9X8_9NEOP|nr:unnamed protein product [Pieris macdunnoughi]
MYRVKAIEVAEEYQKNPGLTPDDIGKLREWLTTQPHLPSKYITDLDLILTYHCCENSAEVSKQVLDLHFTLKTLFTAFFSQRVLDQRLRTALTTALIQPLPTPSVNGYRVIYCRLLDTDSKNFIFSDIVKLFLMVFELWQYEEGTWPGFVIMVDMDQATLAHIAQLDVMSVKQVLYFLQESMLVKLKEVHFLNATSLIDKLMMLIKPFMKKELLDILRIHQRDSDTLDPFVYSHSLPKEDGGDFKSRNILKEEQLRRIEANLEFFEKESKKRVDESVRPGKKTTIEDVFGIQGSFKKLDID